MTFYSLPNVRTPTAFICNVASTTPCSAQLRCKGRPVRKALFPVTGNVELKYRACGDEELRSSRQIPSLIVTTSTSAGDSAKSRLVVAKVPRLPSACSCIRPSTAVAPIAPVSPDSASPVVFISRCRNITATSIYETYRQYLQLMCP